MARQHSEGVGPFVDPEARNAAACLAVAANLVRRTCAPDVGRPDEVLLSLSLALGVLESALTVKDAAQRLWPAQLKVIFCSSASGRDRIFGMCCAPIMRHVCSLAGNRGLALF